MILTWDAADDDTISGYRVLRGPDAGRLTELASDTRSGVCDVRRPCGRARDEIRLCRPGDPLGGRRAAVRGGLDADAGTG